MSFSNEQIAQREDGFCPVFDIRVRAQKRNPFSQMSLNETAKELFSLGVFSPQKAREGLIMLELMEFEGKDIVTEKLRQIAADQSSDTEQA